MRGPGPSLNRHGHTPLSPKRPRGLVGVGGEGGGGAGKRGPGDSVGKKCKAPRKGFLPFPLPSSPFPCHFSPNPPGFPVPPPLALAGSQTPPSPRHGTGLRPGVGVCRLPARGGGGGVPRPIHAGSPAGEVGAGRGGPPTSRGVRLLPLSPNGGVLGPPFLFFIMRFYDLGWPPPAIMALAIFAFARCLSVAISPAIRWFFYTGVAERWWAPSAARRSEPLLSRVLAKSGAERLVLTSPGAPPKTDGPRGPRGRAVDAEAARAVLAAGGAIEGSGAMVLATTFRRIAPLGSAGPFGIPGPRIVRTIGQMGWPTDLGWWPSGLNLGSVSPHPQRSSLCFASARGIGPHHGGRRGGPGPRCGRERASRGCAQAAEGGAAA